MRCLKCFRPLDAAAKVCPHCGAPVNKLGSASLVGEELARLRAQMAEDARLAGSPGLGFPTVEPSRDNPPASAGAAPARALVHPEEWVSMFCPQPEQINQSARFVFDSPFIQSNPLYQHRIGQVKFVFVPGETTVNAFATDAPLPVSEDRAIEPPVIVFYGGLAAALRLASAALAVHIRARRRSGFSLARSNLSAALHTMGRTVAARGGLDVETSLDVFRQTVLADMVPDDERFVSLARSYAAAMDMFVVAHEAGHLALAHTLGRATNYDVSRNQEREADSFASSALCTSPFREYLFLGQVFVTIVFAWVEAGLQARQASTHPLARQRFLYAIESNSEAAREAAEEFGLSRQVLTEMLPEAA